MPNVCKVKCGDKEVTLIIQRPSFESVEKAYREITPFYNRDYQESYNRLYKIIIEKNTTNSIIQEQINQIIEYYAYSESRYFRIGGNAYNQFINNMNAYYNTCALRVSYSLNQSTHPIKDMEKQNTSRAYKGNDGNIYYLGVPDIVELLNKNWKELSWNKSTYNQIKANIQCGCSEDFYQGMANKQDNINFFTELQSIQRKGIVAMRGPKGFNHTTLWEVDNFVDVKLGTSKNYLLEVDILIRDFYFWELK